MKANYNKKPKIDERSITFRTKKSFFSVYQNTLYDRLPQDRNTVYLDFKNEEEIDKLINTLQVLKESLKENNNADNT